jgi:hypothetical protein
MTEITPKQLTTLKQEVQDYLDENLIPEGMHVDYGRMLCCEIIAEEFPFELKPTFSQTLFKFIKKQGISETECYKNAHLDRRLFSKIRSNENYQPRKNTVMALIIGLKLNLEDASDLLDSAGYTLSESIKQDMILEYLIQKEVYDIMVVNEILFSFDCPILGMK